MLECADGMFYVGITNDLQDRLREHNAGEVIFTARRRPIKMIWFEEHCDQGSARRRERQLKKWRREKKK